MRQLTGILVLKVSIIRLDSSFYIFILTNSSLYLAEYTSKTLDYGRASRLKRMSSLVIAF